MKPFKFLRGEKNMLGYYADREINFNYYAPYIPLLRTPEPVEDELYVTLTDINTGEHFGIPAALNFNISYRARLIFDAQRTVSGRCDFGQYEYWIDNVYRTITTYDRLVIDVTIAVPNNTIRDTFHKIRQVIPYD